MSELSIDHSADECQYLTFFLAKEEYGVDILRVMEIRNWEQPTPIPEAPACIKGVLNIRGTMVPILDLRQRLGLELQDYSHFTVVIIVQIGENEHEVLGLIVDAVSDVYNITNEQHKPVPSSALGKNDSYIKHLAMHDKETIIILDCEELIADKASLYKITPLQLEHIKKSLAKESPKDDVAQETQDPDSSQETKE